MIDYASIILKQYDEKIALTHHYVDTTENVVL